MSVPTKQSAMRSIAGKLCRGGFAVMVHNGKEEMVVGANTVPKIVAAMGSLNADFLHVSKDGKSCGWVFVRYDVAPANMVDDWTENLTITVSPSKAKHEAT